MSVPDRRAIVEEFARVYGLPNNLIEDTRREWIRKVAETLAAKFPGEGWGNKARSESQPIAGDVLATRSPFEAVDVLTGSADSSECRLVWNEINPATLPGQAWIPVTPHDYLAQTPQEPPQEPPSEPPTGPLPVDLSPVLARLDVLEALMRGLAPAGGYLVTGSLAVPYLGSAKFTGTAEPRK